MSEETTNAEKSNEERLEDRKKAAEARIRERREERERLERERALEAEIDRVEQEGQVLDALAEAEAEHGPKKVSRVETSIGSVVIRAPHHAMVKRFQDDESTSMDSVDRLVGPCVVYPSRDTYEALLVDKPGARITVLKALLLLSGFQLKETQGKS